MGLSNGRGDPDPELDPDPDRAGPEAQGAHGACARGSTGRAARPRFRQSPPEEELRLAARRAGGAARSGLKGAVPRKDWAANSRQGVPPSPIPWGCVLIPLSAHPDVPKAIHTTKTREPKLITSHSFCFIRF